MLLDRFKLDTTIGLKVITQASYVALDILQRITKSWALGMRSHVRSLQKAVTEEGLNLWSQLLSVYGVKVCILKLGSLPEQFLECGQNEK